MQSSRRESRRGYAAAIRGGEGAGGGGRVGRGGRGVRLTYSGKRAQARGMAFSVI